jgi:hypothetical protein
VSTPIDEEKLENMITQMLNPISEERSAVISKKFAITGSKKLPIARRAKASGARSAILEHDSVDVYVFTTENTASGTEGYVLASTDMRIGNILAVVDGKTLEDEEEWFTDIIFEGIEGYIARTIDQYESIDEEEMQQILEKPSIARVVLPPGTSGSDSDSWHYGMNGLIHHWYPDAAPVISASWSWTRGYDARVPVNWGQGNPYNYYVCRARNANLDDYVTGCGPTAIAQVMAYHGWPLKVTLTGAMNATIPYVNMNIQNYVYNWASMRNNFWPVGDSITGGAKDIAVLMYEIGHAQRGDATYNKKQVNKGPSTSITQKGVLTALVRMGYTSPSTFVTYKYEFIESSIGLGRPVIVCGSDGNDGHVWVIDGVRKMTYVEYLTDGASWYWDGWDFVHCNLGWNGWCDAWYVNGIFDTREDYRSFARNTISGYFQYKIEIVPDIRPVR